MFKDGERVKVVRVIDESMNFVLGKVGYFCTGEKPDEVGYYYVDFGYFKDDEGEELRYVLMHVEELESYNV